MINKELINEFFRIVYEEKNPEKLIEYAEKNFSIDIFDRTEVELGDITNPMFEEMDEQLFDYFYQQAKKYNFPIIVTEKFMKRYIETSSDEEIVEYFDHIPIWERDKNLLIIAKQKEHLLEKVARPYEIPHIILRLKDENLIVKYFKYIDNELTKEAVIGYIKSEKNILCIIPYIIDSSLRIKTVLHYLKSVENRIESLKYLTISEQVIIIMSFYDDNLKIQFIREIEEEQYRASVISSLKDDEAKYEEYLKLEDDEAKLTVIESFKSEEFKIKIVEGLTDEYTKARAICYIKDKKKQLFFISQLNDEENRAIASKNLDVNLKYRMIKTFKKYNSKMILLNELSIENIEELFKNGKIANEYLQYFRHLGCFESTFISENIEEFIKREVGDETKIHKELLSRYEKPLSKFYKNINFNFLTDRYIKLFTEEQFGQFLRSYEIQEALVEMSADEKKFKFITNIIENCNKYFAHYESCIYTIYTIINLCHSGEYDKLIENINLEENIDYERLIYILTCPNYFGIESYNDVNNYTQLKNAICDEIMDEKVDRSKYKFISKLDKLDQKKLAILQKLYAIDLQTATSIAKMYGQDIDKIQPENVKDSNLIMFVESLKRIVFCDNEELLNSFYKISESVQESKVKPFIMQKELKNLFCKEYNKGLYNPNEHEVFTIDEGIKIYEAGTEFKMIVTSIGAFVQNKNAKNNYKDDWNRDSNTSSCFCASFIRNDMIGTAPRTNVCYGFYNMGEDSLMESSPEDLGSSTEGAIRYTEKDSRFIAEDRQVSEIDPMWGYNEMIYSRIQNNQRKQPDFIVVFRRNGKIENIEESKKAAKDFGNIPIVVIDPKECAKSEFEKLSKIIDEYLASDRNKLKFEMIKRKFKSNYMNLEFRYMIPDLLRKEFSQDEKAELEELYRYYSDFNYYKSIMKTKKQEAEIERLRMPKNVIKIYEKGNLDRNNILRIAKKINEILLEGDELDDR